MNLSYEPFDLSCTQYDCYEIQSLLDEHKKGYIFTYQRPPTYAQRADTHHEFRHNHARRAVLRQTYCI